MDTLRHAEHPLRRTVGVMCDLLTVQTPQGRNGLVDEARLRDELVGCILSSQVSALSAQGALERIKRAGLLANARWKADDPEFEIELANALRFSSDRCGGYRFPHSKAAQLSKLRLALRHCALRGALARERDPRRARRWLITLPGVGPKQASMFLRNIGFSYALAILDVHVLSFLHGIGVLCTPQPRVATLAQYEKVEILAIEYAKTCEREVGYLDWAIWITMKAMRELQK
jgi:N-glycosylase/DNA lyase